MLVHRVRAVTTVRDEDDGLGPLDRLEDLLPDFTVEWPLWHVTDATRVHQEEVATGPIDVRELPIPGNPALFRHDCDPATYDAVEQRGLAHIGSSHYRDRGKAYSASRVSVMCSDGHIRNSGMRSLSSERERSSRNNS